MRRPPHTGPVDHEHEATGARTVVTTPDGKKHLQAKCSKCGAFYLTKEKLKEE